VKKSHRPAPAASRRVRSESRPAVEGTNRPRTAAVQPASVPVAAGQTVEVEIVGMTHEGEGVGRVEGYTLFVAGALPDERVRAEVRSVGASYGRARLLSVVRPAPGRRRPPCPIYAECGGCQLQHWDYEAQLRWKRRHVADNLARIGKLPVADALSPSPAPADERPPVVVHPTIGMADPWRYRNKAQVPIGAGEGGLVGGFFEQGSHDIVDMDACLIQSSENESAVCAVKRIARSLGLSPYDRQSGRGLLRHVIVRHARATGQIMVVLVTAARDLPHADELVSLIRAEIPGVTSICQNIQPARTSLVFGDETRVLWGDDVIYDEIGGIRFAVSARSFFQVNPEQTEKLYRQTLAYAGLTGNETVVDAYCGIGTITLFLARHARQVYGVEIVPEAIADARRNARLNGIGNVEFVAGAAEDVMPRWQAAGIRPDVVVVDPPRKGCNPALLDTILAMRPARIVYVSCNPSTLARDLRRLEDGDYRTVEAQPVDMFPWTGHIESVSFLVRNETES